jgi:hypothetical protein
MNNLRFAAMFAWGLLCASIASLFDVSGLTLEWAGMKLLVIGNRLHKPADQIISYIFDLNFD